MSYKEVVLGSTVTLKNETGFVSYTLVPRKYENKIAHRVSVTSPIGRKLYHKHTYDLVRLPVPGKRATFIVAEVK